MYIIICITDYFLRLFGRTFLKSLTHYGIILPFSFIFSPLWPQSWLRPGLLESIFLPGSCLWTPGCTSCTCPGLSSPDQLAVHSSISICCWSPGARLRGVRRCRNDRWFIWVNLPLWLEESGGSGDKERDGGRNGEDAGRPSSMLPFTKLLDSDHKEMAQFD